MPGFLEDLDIQRNAAHRDGFDPEPPPPRRRDAGLLRTLTLAVAFSAALIAARPRAASQVRAARISDRSCSVAGASIASVRSSSKPVITTP